MTGFVHDAILEAAGAKVAVLSTQVDNDAALAPCRGRGWSVVVPEVAFAPDEPLYAVLGWEQRGADA